MDSVSSISVYSENIRTTQPFLSKRGLTLQGNAVNPLSGVEKIADFFLSFWPEIIGRVFNPLILEMGRKTEQNV